MTMVPCLEALWLCECSGRRWMHEFSKIHVKILDIITNEYEFSIQFLVRYRDTDNMKMHT